MRGRVWLGQVLALNVKEFKEIRRDPSSWLVAFILPFIFLLLFGYGITLDAGVLPVAIMDYSRGAHSLSLASTFASSPWFKTCASSDMATAGQLMSDSRIQGIVVIRENFDRRLAASLPGQLQVLVDGSEPNNAQYIRNYTTGLIQTWAANRSGAQSSIDLAPRIWFNPDAKSEKFLIPGSITVIMTLIGTLLTSLVFAREWERGTLETLIAYPISRAQILLSKIVPYFCLGMTSLGVCVLVAVVLFHIPFRGSVWALLLISSIFLLSALGQGLFISISLKGQLVAAEAGLFTGFLPALMLSGFIFDIESMPVPVQAVTKILPATYFNTCLRTLFLAGDYWDIFLPSLMYLSLLACILLSLVYIKIPRHLPK